MLEVIIGIADVVLVFVLAVMSWQIQKVLRVTVPPKYATKIGADVDLPSVTVCIPARNEQHALIDCLQRIIASDYERLEIIVLDDASSDDTTSLIKSFASDGVRFVQGSPLPKGWLGKNYALQGLLEEASGSYILFVDVDTLLSPRAVEHMVRFALSHRASMVSVLPRREDGWRLSVLFSPLRYFWEIIFSRRLWPATSSNAWLIRRDVLLKRFDGFKSFKNTVQPEAKIATELAQTNEYKFLVSTSSFGVAYEKKWSSQLLTSIRLLYPLLGKNWSLVVLALFDIALFLLPFVLIVLSSITTVSAPYLTINYMLAASFCVAYGMYTYRVWRKGWLVGALLWPLLLIQEAVLIVVSMYKHHRNTVTWKGRPIQPEAQN